MRVWLLGPVEARVDGSPLPLGGRGERALLARLALSPRRPVAATTLVEELWEPGRLPADPLNALQLRVSKLRRTLAVCGEPRLHREGVGYRLDVDADDVDVHRFAALITDARGAGDPVQAAGLYDRALAMWRGDPFVDFAGEPWSVVETVRLTELRLAAVGERAERMLALGRYADLVADLEPEVARSPARERLVGQLMTALFNTGRQADALQVYANTKAVLADELGVDPSRELRALMLQILRQDPSVAPSRSPAGTGRHRGGGAAGGTVSHNLPLRVTSFVGRTAELGRTVDLLQQHRLVTLAGAGGAGKTALGIESARVAAPRFRDGARLVRLAAVTDAGALEHTVADAVGINIEGGTAIRRSRDVLIGQLAPRELLLLLDNCEHLIEAVASLVEAILARCPGVRVLTTSREVLAVPGEIQVPVAPLAVPEPDTAPGEVPNFPAARLFLDRAAAIATPLDSDDELAAVAQICRRLDGIPLGLELAAARLASLTPAELADRVVDRFAVLTSGSRTADARQQTLRNTVDWSHDLLTDRERLLFRRLAVFRGGWTLAAAEQVVSRPDLPPDCVLDVLERLVRQSLVVPEQSTGHTRYRMLETLRQYAEDRLDDAAERPALAAAHARHYLQVAEQAETGLRGPSQPHWLRVLGEEHANLRAALAWLTAGDGQADGALRMAGSLGLYWHMGRHLEGRETLRQVMALPGGSPHARARAMQAISLVERPRACLVHPSDQCAAAARDSLEIFIQVGDRPRATFSRLLLSVEGVGSTRRSDAEQLLEQANAEFAVLGDDWGQAVAAFVRLEMMAKRGNQPAATQAAAQAATLFRRLGDGWGLSATLYHWGWALCQFGRHADAVPVLQEAIDVADRAGIHNTVQWATGDLGLALLSLGRMDDASLCFARTGTVTDQVGDESGKALAAYGEAVLAQRQNRHTEARPLFARALDGFQRMGVSLPTGLALAGLAACDEEAGDAASARAGYQRLLKLAEGTREADLAITALDGLTRSTLLDGDFDRAAELMGRAAWLRENYDRPAGGAERVTTDQAAEAARSALGTRAFAEATQRGISTGLGGAP